jgi:hypothetical protein
MTYKPKEKILTAAQLCQWWDITPDQLDKLRREKDLPHIELLRGTYIFTEKSLAEWAERHLNSPLKAPKST